MFVHRLIRAVAALALAGTIPVVAADQPAAPAIRVGVLTDNYPYSFVDKDGRLVGFGTELLEGVEQVMGLKFERVTGTTQEIWSAFREGRIEVVQSLAHFSERESEADFSVPYLTMLGAIIVRDDEKGIQSLEDLRGRRVMVHPGSLGERVLLRAGLADSIMHVKSVEEAMVRLNAGEGDATLATRMSALALAHRIKLKHVRAVDAKVDGFEVRYCVAVQKGEAELLARINEGLAVLVRTGRFDEIYGKWFNHLEPGKYSVAQVLSAVAAGLAIALLVALWAAWKQGKLHRRLVRQATQLRASEERFRTLFEGDLEGLLVVRQAGGRLVVEQANPAAQRFFSRVPFAKDVPLEDLFASDAELVRRVAEARDQRVEFEHERADGRAAWRVVVNPIGERTLVALSDVSDAVASRRRLQLQEAQLSQKQKLEAVGTLAGGVAHDFNNLLTAIMGNLELTLMNLPPDHPEASGLKVAQCASRRARELVQQILAFSRQAAPRQESVELRALVDEMVNVLQALQAREVEFEVLVPAEVPALRGNPTEIHRVLLNLGTNAVQAMRGQPGKLTFSAELVEAGEELRSQQIALRPGRYVRLTVQDTGPGMTEEVQQRAFEPFFTTKPPGEGTGLGLSVVHGIMQQHGGAVVLYSHPGRGTVFHLYFPAAPETALPALESEAAPVRRGFGERILLVDDEIGTVETGRRMLERMGYSVSAHVRAELALADFRSRPDAFDLVIADLAMPELPGLKFIAAVKALRPGQEFVLCSGIFSESERRAAADLGITLLVQKPLTYAALGEAVAAALARVAG